MALESQKQWRQRVQQKTLELEQAKVRRAWTISARD